MSLTAVGSPEQPDAVRHEHVHRFDEGERRFTHAHVMPKDAHDVSAARPHRHKNGRHSHPHMNHRLYGV